MRNRVVVTLLALVLVGAISHGSAQTAPAAVSPAQKAGDVVSGERIRAHVKFLSSDLLEGRGMGQRGSEIAAEYIATQFALDGLQPAGDNGTFFQKVPMVGIATQPESVVTLAPEKGNPISLRLGKDVVAMDESQNAVSDIDAPIIFVGYGIEAPEFRWNDFKDVDVKGKVLLVLVNEPPSDDPKFFNGKALTYYGRWTYKFEEAARKGAVGALIIHKTDMASYGWNVVETSWGGERSSLRGGTEPTLKLASWISYETGNQLAALMGSNVEKLIASANSRDFRPVPLPVRLKARMVSKVRPFDSANVLALLPGAGRELRDQAVVYSAHYDHLGIHPDQPGDNIYNGAVDNATGCGLLLEMAHAFASVPERPARSILFAAVTGEEQGLLGSEYLGKHPPIPAGKISLGLNFDGLAPIGVPEAIEVTGAERTTFYPALQQLAREFKFAIEPDSNPGAGHYYRSDHFSFARVGIPAFSVSQGNKFEGHPASWGEEWEKNFVAKNYHQPSDEYHADWDFRGEAKIARFAIALGWAAADAPKLVAWQAGDEFETARKSSTQSSVLSTQ
jgi:Zn-dependent M28 family amino/carboxypeptidase